MRAKAHLRDYDLYIFDWDGTLAQTITVWLPLVREIITKYGAEATDRELVRTIFGRSSDAFLEYGVPAEDLPVIVEDLIAKAAERLSGVPLYPGAREVLATLKRQGKQCALITSSARVIISKTLPTVGLAEVFTAIVAGKEAPHKPDPEGIERLLTELAAPPHRALMLGDSEKDVLAAHNAGIDSVLFFPADHHLIHDRKELLTYKPTYVIASWQEFGKQLQ